MTPERKFYRNGFQHIFQISVDRGLIFYTDEDCIVFFTILCSMAVKYRVRIVAVCIMKNHFHILVQFVLKDNMESFLNALCSVFARKYNFRYNRKGKLFRKPYGNAPKYGDDIYGCIIYIYNNPIPKKARETAAAYRWNFLAYMDSRNPFSTPLNNTSDTTLLKQRFSTVERIHSSGKYIDYAVLDSLKEGLNDEQYLQLLDHIVSVYNVIDYSLIQSKWKSRESLCEMLGLVKGLEYDLNEDVSREDYRNYERMNVLVRKAGFNLSRRRFDSEDADPSQISRLRGMAVYSINPSDVELAKYFHTGEYARR